MLNCSALADAFFSGVDKFLIDLFVDKKKASVAEQRLEKLAQATPFKVDRTVAI